MKNETNIYDIDGNIIRKAGDNHRFTIDEIEKLVDDLTEKVRNNPDNETYKVYLNNAQKWLFNMYNSMTPEEIKSRLSILQSSINNAKSAEAEAAKAELEQISDAIDQLKEEYESEPMDEYVEPIEEVEQ